MSRAVHRVLAAVFLAGGVLFLSAGTAAADHDLIGEVCGDPSTAEPDEPVSSAGSTGSHATDDTTVAEPDVACTGGGGSAGSPESGGPAIPSFGTETDDGNSAADRVVAAAEQGCPSGGVEGGEVGDPAGVLAPDVDSETADVDTGAAEPDSGLPSLDSFGFSMASGASVSTAAIGCPMPIGDVGDVDGQILAPNRIDAGAGAIASTSAAGPGTAAIMGGSALLAAALEGLRRRRRR